MEADSPFHPSLLNLQSLQAIVVKNVGVRQEAILDGEAHPRFPSLYFSKASYSPSRNMKRGFFILIDERESIEYGAPSQSRRMENASDKGGTGDWT